MRTSELRAILEQHPHDDGEIVIELPGTDRAVQTISWSFSPDGTRFLVLADL